MILSTLAKDLCYGDEFAVVVDHEDKLIYNFCELIGSIGKFCIIYEYETEYGNIWVLFQVQHEVVQISR